MVVVERDYLTPTRSSLRLGPPRPWATAVKGISWNTDDEVEFLGPNYRVLGGGRRKQIGKDRPAIDAAGA